MKPFTIHTGKIAVINRGNIDTDQIISKEFLKSIKRTGFGEALFHHWRFSKDGTPNPDFELNQPRYANASILVTGNNFGCGSSREHAVWSVEQFGFKVVIAPYKGNGTERIPGFADIFKNNSAKNGLLLIEFSEAEVEEIIKTASSREGTQATVALPQQKFTLHLDGVNKVFSFEIDAATKEKLIQGLDDIGETEKYSDQIQAFEAGHNSQIPAAGA